MNIKIRDFRESDVIDIVLITSQSFSIPWSASSLIESIKNSNSVTKVADLDGEIVGYILLRIISDEAEILSIAVKPSFRGLGIGRSLLDAILEELKSKVKKCFLEVRKSNRVAIALYENSGFEICGNRKNYYIQPQEDALLMVKDLENS